MNYLMKKRKFLIKRIRIGLTFLKIDKKLKKENSNNIPTCPNCSRKLTFMMPDGKTLYCDNCKKYYVNNNGVAGEETGSPYTRTDVLY